MSIRRQLSIWLLSTVVGVGSLTGAEAPVAEVETFAPKAEQVIRGGEGEGYSFNPPPREERRDIFYDIIKLRSAIAEAARLQKKEDALREGAIVKTSAEVDGEGLFAAEQFAEQVLEEIRLQFLQQKWKSMIAYCDQKLNRLRELSDKFPESKRLREVITRVRNAKLQAEEKYRYELAKAEFDALNIKVEGIVWAADGVSLAIINGEEGALAVNEKVRKDAAVIVSIDQNRVDFMVVHDANTFHFQRYIREEGEN